MPETPLPWPSHEDTINHQATQDPIQGREAVREMLERELKTAEMVCILETIHESAQVAA